MLPRPAHPCAAQGLGRRAADVAVPEGTPRGGLLAKARAAPLRCKVRPGALPGRLGRVRARRVFVEQQRLGAALRIQRWARVRAARAQRTQALRRRREASLQLQCCVRGSIARAEAARRRATWRRQQRNGAAARVQQAARRFLARTRRARSRAAVAIQCRARARAALRHVRMVRAFADASLSAESTAKIQAASRGRRARRDVQRLRLRRDGAAWVLQRAARCAARREAQSRRTRRGAAAVVLQMLVRRRLAVRRSRQLRRRHLCAWELQRVWRGRRGRRRALRAGEPRRRPRRAWCCRLAPHRPGEVGGRPPSSLEGARAEQRFACRPSLGCGITSTPRWATFADASDYGATPQHSARPSRFSAPCASGRPARRPKEAHRSQVRGAP